MPFEPDTAGRAAPGRFVPDAAPEPDGKKPGAVAEIARNAVPWLGEGVNNILGAVPQLVAPEGGAAEFFKNNAEWWRGTQSDDVQRRMREANVRIDKAGEDGVLSQIGSAASEYYDDPALAARLAVTNLPSMIPGLALGKAAQLASVAAKAGPAAQAALGLGVAGATNAGLNAGGARGDAFEEIKTAAMARGMSERDATDLALEGSKLPAAVGAATGFIGGRTGVEKALLGKASGGKLLGRAAGAVGAEIGGELVEEVAPKVTTNFSAQALDPQRSLGQDVGRTIVETAVGAGPGAALAGGGTAYRGIKENDAAPVPGVPGVPGAIPAAEALGRVDPPSEAEKALTAEPTPMRPERIAAVPGLPTTFSTEAGARLEGQYALVEADQALASHDTELRPNAAYPTDLQPRDRTRAASEAQIASIVGKLDPARLGQSATAGDGAPIIGEDGLVESGNARTIALQRIYRSNGQKAEDYKTWLRDNAASFGLQPDQIAGMRQPMLVRVRTTPVNRAEFARQANASTVAAMSPLEQARSDAARIDSMDDLRPDEQGEFATSRDFIRRFVGRLPATEQAGMIDAGGQLSSSGYSRVRNAVLAKAYGDSPVLTRMVESMDDNLRNVSKALMLAAPRIAQTRQAIADGRLHGADVTPDLLAAVTELSAIKERGGSVADALAQRGLEGDRLTPESREILTFLQENLRSPRKIAEFLGSYADALDAAGDPNQGNLLGETQAPTVKDLLTAAKREAVRPVSETGKGKPAAEAANETPVDGDWRAFGSETGTLGVPRAEMPQVRMKARPELFEFLQSRGIGHTVTQLDADTLKPTQAEYSEDKTVRAAEITAPDDPRNQVLVSSDGYIIDGHHRWLASARDHGQINAVQFDAPVGRVLDAMMQFPGTTVNRESAGAVVASPRDLAVADLKAAVGELGDFLTRHMRAAFTEQDEQRVMPILVKVFDAGIRVVGTDLKRVMAWVRDHLRRNKDVLPGWNKIPATVHRKAAEKALGSLEERGQQMGLFTDAEIVQPGLFDGPAEPAAPTVATINGRPYDMGRDNFKPPAVADFMPAEVLVEADGYVERYYVNRPPPSISAEDRARAEALLQPLIEKATADKPAYDQQIIDIAQRSGAIGQMLAPVKTMKRSAEKLVLDEKFNVDGMKDMLRSTIVVQSYADAQRVVDEIIKEFKVLRILDRTEGTKLFGYRDVLANVVMPSGVIAEIQINVPEMLSAKEAHGHKLYEAYREAPKESPLGQEIGAAMQRFYEAARVIRPVAAKSRLPAAQDKKLASDIGAQPAAGKSLRGSSEAPSSDSLNTPPPAGNTTNSSPENEAQNSQPAGNLSGTSISSPSPVEIVSQKGDNAPQEGGPRNDDSDANDREGDAGSRARPARPAQGNGQVGAVPAGDGRGDQQPGGDGIRADNGSGQPAVQPEGRDDAGARRSRHGKRARRGAAIPAGRDIKPKSGLNYRFTDEDISPPGSWAKRAAANVEAVELVKKLQAEGRQATPDEQRKLAQFVGWGASEIANNLFGKKLDKAGEALRQYERAAAAFDKRGNQTMRRDPYRGYQGTPDGWYDAFSVMQFADDKISYNTLNEITREQLDKAAPPKSTQRWLALRDRLKAALTAEEYAEAQRSTQYGHYTSAGIVRGMWRAAERFGFKGGLVLEPGGGKGNFPGLMPDALAANASYTGIEYDSITGAILGYLFPDEMVRVESYIDTKLPRDFYDLGIGNPPFAGLSVLADPEYKKHAFKLHDYFFAKTLDRVRPGGMLMFVTSRFTMDKQGDKARQYMAERADLVGAIRLPQTAFKENAGTEVVTDVLFLRKKVPGETFEQDQAWARSVPVDVGGTPEMLNEYFAAHPEMVLGTHSRAGSMYAKDEYTVLPADGDIEALFAAAVDRLPADVMTAATGSAANAAQVRELDFNPTAKKEGNFYVNDKGIVMQREGGVGLAVRGLSAADEAVVKSFVPLRDALKQAQYDQLNDGDWQSSLATLQAAYKAFTAAHGQINQFKLRETRVKVDVLDDQGEPTGTKEWGVEERPVYPLASVLQDDPEFTLVRSLENVNEETGAITQSDFLSKRVLGAPKAAQIATPHDALLAVLNDTGRVDIAAIADRLDMDEADVIEALGSAVYLNPQGSAWETADQYLSGDVGAKMRLAEAAAKTDRRFERNLEPLRAAQPPAKSPANIDIGIGMNWIPGSVYEAFIRETAGVRASVQWNDATRQWAVSFDSSKRGGKASHQSDAATDQWGTGERHAGELLEHALTGRPVKITKTVGSGKDAKTVSDPAAMEAANAKLEALKVEFGKWVWRDTERADFLVKTFNDQFNSIAPRTFDGRHLTLPGTSALFNVFDHVKRGAWRIIQSGNTYLAHAVGSGKTFEMVISAMEQKRLGLIKKPMMVVPNHMLQQFAAEWLQLYPAARLMVADENAFHKDKRRQFVSRVALSDLDGVIITHSAFKLLDIDSEYRAKIVDEQLDFMRAALEQAEDEDGDGGKGGKKSPRVKQIENRIEALEQKLKAAQKAEAKDQNARFDELGVDMLYVDEAHVFRKLDFGTARQIKGISPEGSDAALDMYIKTRWLEEKNPGRSLVFASGTPITNTVAELYSVMRFLGRQTLIDKGIEDFDSWAAMFGRAKTALEANAAGKYEPVTRFSEFVNVPGLIQMFKQFADVLTADNLAAMLGDKRPKVQGGSRTIVVTPKTTRYRQFQRVLAARYEASRKWKPSRDEPNNPDPVIAIIGDGRLAAIDMRFINPSAPSDPGSKLNRMIDDVIQAFNETKDLEYTDKKTGKVEPNKGSAMMVFSDLGFGEGVAANRGFNARAWMEKRLRDAGVPKSQIAFMSDYKKSSAKLALFKDVNAGRVRILVGSSKNMGTGVNAQQRLLDLFHLDSPWFPADLEQREGRIVRQGNKNKEVRIRAYAAKGSYDETMWGMLARKAFFIGQALEGDPNMDRIEDLDSMSQYDLAAAMVAEDPRVLQLAGIRAEVEKMHRLYQAHEDQRQKFRGRYLNAEREVSFARMTLPDAEAAAAKVVDLSGDNFKAAADGKSYDERKAWGQALKDAARYQASGVSKSQEIGKVSGFPVRFVSARTDTSFIWHVQLETPVPALLVADGTEDPVQIALKAARAVADVARLPALLRDTVQRAEAERDSLRTRLDTPFPMRELLASKQREAKALEDDIASSSKDRPWRVERIDTGMFLQVMAHNEETAVDKGMEQLGGEPEFWRATELADVREYDAEESMAAAAMGMIPPPTFLSRGAAGGIALPALRAVHSRVAGKLKGLPKVNVLASPADAPAELREFIEKRGATGNVEGAFHNGEIYLFASGIEDETRAEHVLAEHEAAHAGLAGLLGSGKQQVMQALHNGNVEIRRAAKPLIDGGMSLVEAVEEVIVDMPSAALARLKGWRMVVGKMRDALARLGFDRMAAQLDRWLAGQLTEQQRADLAVGDLVRAARRFVIARRAPRLGIAPTRLSAATGAAPAQTQAPAAQRAEAIIQTAAGTPKPLDAFAKTLTRITGLNRLTAATHGLGARLLDSITPERVKAGVVSDYGVPEAVIDRRALLQGQQREQLRQAGKLLEKLTTMTRQESRVAYEWMSGDDTRAADEIMADLPEESVAVLRQVRTMIDDLSKEAVRLGQLDPEAFKRHRFAYLRRSYFKHAQELTTQEKTARQRAISILGDQYKGRGIVEQAAMSKIQNAAPDWWKRKTVAGKADTSLKGEKFERLERRAHKGAGTDPLGGMGENTRPPKLLEVVYWPKGEPRPAKYADWDVNGTFEVTGTKGGDVTLWRDFTKAEREKMGEIDEARYAIAKTLQRMIHDIEVGKYLEWVAQRYAKLPGEPISGTIVEASERYRDSFTASEWVQVPDTSIPGTSVKKYGKLSGQYIPGPIWNDLRQIVAGRFMPLGETYHLIQRAWKTAKTALSPTVHTNNVMSNFVMADWHDVSAGHVAKALRIILGASERQGKGAIGRAGNVVGQLGIADTDAAREILTRYENSGGAIGGWITQEIANEQLTPIVEQLQKELTTTARAAAPAEIGIYSALQHALSARFPQAWEAAKGSRPAQSVVREASAMIDLYQAEDDVFRLAAWLKAKEEGKSDPEAGKAARQSFLDYSINAPWVQILRGSALPFIAYTYRAVPMLIETAAKRPHKILKLMMILGAANALFASLAGGEDDDEARKLLPDEKAGRVWGLVPKLVRMPWNDPHGSPVFLDIRRWIPVGDVFDVGQGQAALPMPPALMPGGPLVILGEILFNKSAFTGKPIVLATDTAIEQATKIVDHLWKAFSPNILGLPGTYASTSVGDAINGRTDAFGREQSVPQAVASSFGVKLGSYPPDVLRRNLEAKAKSQMAEIDMQISGLKRQRLTNRLDQDEFEAQVRAQQAKKREIIDKLQERVN